MPAAKRSLLFPTVVRLRPRSGAFFLAESPEKGWASSGFEYPTLADLLDGWHLRLGVAGADGCSAYIEAHPAAPSATTVLPVYRCDGRHESGGIGTCDRPAVAGFEAARGSESCRVWLFCAVEHRHPCMKPIADLVWERLGRPALVEA